MYMATGKNGYAHGRNTRRLIIHTEMLQSPHFTHLKNVSSVLSVGELHGLCVLIQGEEMQKEDFSFFHFKTDVGKC